MTRALPYGLIYFAILFSLGFVLGTFRVLWLAPYIGETRAVLFELPLMLAASFLVCRSMLRRTSAPTGLKALSMMGGSAFLWLIFAEWILSVTLFGRSTSEFITSVVAMPGVLGLVGQIAFGLCPLWFGLRAKGARPLRE